MKNMLMIAFHYPPFAGGSGVHRTLKFSRYLPDYGWRPIVVTANPRAYPNIGESQLREIPDSVLVKRVFALDTSRQLALFGSYLKVMALPDRWVSWLLGALPSALRIIKQYQPRLIWSTYPIATAHLIGFFLSKLSGLPWVTDFRDSMTEENYPRDPLIRRCYQWIEHKAVQNSRLCIFTAPSARDMYLSRYSELRPESCVVIQNGFDENDFHSVETLDNPPIGKTIPLRLVHAGVVYPDERDPRPFFRALATMKTQGIIDAQSLRVELRGSGSEAFYQEILQELNIEDIVWLLPSLPYHQSLADCASAHALLLLQGDTCNHQIPAKLYEYLRLKKPLLALTHRDGDTGLVLKDSSAAMVVDLKDEQELLRKLPEFFRLVREGQHPIPAGDFVAKFSRQRQAEVLSDYLDTMIDQSEVLQHS